MAVLDVLTVVESRLAVGKETTDTEDAVRLAQMTTSVSLSLDKGAGPVVRRDIVGELHDGGAAGLQLTRWPVTSITTVTELSGTTATVLARETFAAAGGYLAEPYQPDPTLFNGRLLRRSARSDSAWACGRQNVEVSYVAGRYADTAAVDALFKEAASIWLQYLWRTQEPSTGEAGEFEVPAVAWPKFAVPNAVQQLLADVWQAPVDKDSWRVSNTTWAA